MQTKMSWTEILGVVAVGLAMAYGSNLVTTRFKAPKSHGLAMLISGATLYTVGVVIGTKRPAEGWTSKMITGPTAP
jgi:hypothetical protein